MRLEAKYAVKFVGYSAYVIARKNGREIQYATLDFVSGAAALLAEGGCVVVPKRIDLRPFLNSLPKLTNELQFAQTQRNRNQSQQTTVLAERTVGGRAMISLSCGSNTVAIAPGIDVPRFIRTVMKRFNEIEQILEQAETIGLRLNRRSHSAYTNEIAKTGICRVEGHGYGLFVNGRLIFYPNYQVICMRKAGETAFEVHS
jgi:hypothetical protein